MSKELTPDELAKSASEMSQKFDAIVVAEIVALDPDDAIALRKMLSASVIGMSQCMARYFAVMETRKTVRNRLIEMCFATIATESDELAEDLDRPMQ